MILIEIFETVACCSIGVDKEIVRLSSAIKNLKEEGVEIIRHNLSKEPQAFIDNKIINNYIAEHGIEELPITIVNNEIVKLNEYPTSADFSKWTGVAIDESTVEPDSKKCSCSCS